MQVNTLIVLFLLLMMSSSAFSFEEGAISIDSTKINDIKVDSISVDKAYLEAWGITEQEYKRFIYLKNNTPRGVLTPTANPIYYLGLEARTAKERRKYAEKVARLEFENVQNKIQPFNREVRLAVQRLYGAGSAVDMGQAKSLNRELNPLVALDNGVGIQDELSEGRLLYVTVDCDACIDVYKRLLGELSKGDIKYIEIIFPSELTDREIKLWAYNTGVNKELHRRGVVSLRRSNENESVDSFPTVRFNGI
ncbi:hypothetical protein KUL42_38790 [Alteromonas sp. KUL42]|uniref:hypothetical protein n=1 Tax=Alteromonas sp. KUL42 TaxID=2480797 RepID=UPI001036219C|nr:hypothetical protein [Alteromonas sp. KUL42]TAP31686.1 hypothetical protein EYR97_19550 [Alteromonas sp. KUL42]GEA09118.1 hypothetical protein KUL42_38790 [Alteromonas sp. KUL42]